MPRSSAFEGSTDDDSLGITRDTICEMCSMRGNITQVGCGNAPVKHQNRQSTKRTHNSGGDLSDDLREEGCTAVDGGLRTQGRESERKEGRSELWPGCFDSEALLAWSRYSAHTAGILSDIVAASASNSSRDVEGSGRDADQRDVADGAAGSVAVACDRPVDMGLGRPSSAMGEESDDSDTPERDPGGAGEAESLGLRRITTEVVDWSFSDDPVVRFKEAMAAHETERRNGAPADHWYNVALHAARCIPHDEFPGDPFAQYKNSERYKRSLAQ